KILDALRLYIGTGYVSGLVEADETFFRLSYKGNHSKSKGLSMTRRPNLRGPKSKKSENEEPKPRGISRNQVAVICAIDRTGNIISEF
ncbi:MAG: IS1595 family transposase, partial [Peptostreptococcaceae bacterium]|nr:IS1595 family transposase [Peptostreptococcaceae bacterium]